MGRKKLNLTEEERALRKKEQMKKVYEKQKLLKKRLVANLTSEQLEKKRKYYREKARTKRLKLKLGIDDNGGFSDLSDYDFFINQGKADKMGAQNIYEPEVFIEEPQDEIKAENIYEPEVFIEEKAGEIKTESI